MVSAAAGSRVALMSVRPRWADALLTGNKTVELRRASIAPDISHALIYATLPVGAIVGWFEVDCVERASPTDIWKRWGRSAAVSRAEFEAYYAGASRAVAIVVKSAHALSRPIPLREWGHLVRAPQSFVYVEGALAASLGMSGISPSIAA